jgi:acyl carrier protein
MEDWLHETAHSQANQRRHRMPAVTSQQVEARVVEALASFGPEPDEITRESTFEELDIDSLDLVELAQIVEDEYGVVLKGEDMKELQTVGDAVDLVLSKADG